MNLKKHNGFTLVELLSIITILALILVIAVPKVINIVDEVRKRTFENSVYGLIKTGNLYFSGKNLMGGFKNEEIFDMSGGGSETVMAFGYYDNKSNYNLQSGFTDDTYPEAKYINEYSKVYGSAQYGVRILGDAINELGPFKTLTDSWYDEDAYFLGDGSWLVRGSSGLFSFNKSGGGANAFRIVIV